MQQFLDGINFTSYKNVKIALDKHFILKALDFYEKRKKNTRKVKEVAK